VKIGLPKIRFSKKLAIISTGMLALLGGTGAAALYVGKDQLLGPVEASTIGGACQTVQTMVLKTPARRLWLRKFVRMDAGDADNRIRTALRVAGLLVKSNDVDLVQVSVLDDKGPETRANMRGRAIGAEVIIALQPRYLPDMKEPFTVRYYDGPPNDEGRFYGKRVDVTVDDIKKMMASMKSAPDKEDCTDIPKPEAAASAEGEGHAAKPAGGVHAAEPAEGGHEAAPAEGAAAEGGHDAAAPATGHEAAAAVPAKPSMMDSMLGMVGLGGSAKPAAESQDASGKGETASAAPEKDKSFMNSMLGMVGLGGRDATEPKPAQTHVAPAHDATEQDHAAPAPGHEPQAEAAGHEAAPAAENSHEAAPEANSGHAPEPEAAPAAEQHSSAEPAAHAEKELVATEGEQAVH
jgi:hypothetical protein